jgi:hypothetical protein
MTIFLRPKFLVYGFLSGIVLGSFMRLGLFHGISVFFFLMIALYCFVNLPLLLKTAFRRVR